MKIGVHSSLVLVLAKFRLSLPFSTSHFRLLIITTFYLDTLTFENEISSVFKHKALRTEKAHRFRKSYYFSHIYIYLYIYIYVTGFTKRYLPMVGQLL